MPDRNENREGYKKTKVGWIPVEWDCVAVDTVGKRVTGHTPSQGKSEYWNGGVKWVSLADSWQLDNPWLTETAKEISEEGIKHSSTRMLPAETVVLLRDAAVGKAAILGKDMTVSQHFVGWICDNELIPFFLYSYLVSQRRYFERMAVGTTIVTIGMGLFEKLTLPLPPIAEQEKIAEILSTWDAGIEDTRKLIAAKKRQKKALMQQLLTGEVRVTA